MNEMQTRVQVYLEFYFSATRYVGRIPDFFQLTVMKAGIVKILLKMRLCIGRLSQTLIFSQYFRMFPDPDKCMYVNS